MDGMAVTWTQALVAAATALGGALVVVVAAHLLVRGLGRRWPLASRLSDQARRPFRALVLVLAATGWVAGVRTDEWWWGAAAMVGRLASIGAGAWLLAAVLLFVEDLTLGRANVDVRDNLQARRVRTQVLLIRRLTIAAVVVVALGAMLLSFPGVRTLGASLLASAGLISVVAALAAQSTLANVFAGIQLAFNDAIRVDDAVIVEDEWGRIEEITLSYVVVQLWDDRRLVLPSTYFTTTPFQNWTRKSSELMGAVELDVDWGVDPEAIRAELPRIMEDAGQMWDGRTAHVQVTDAVGGFVRVRVLVTSYDAPTLFDLRCHVRERLVAWVREQQPAGLPRLRVERSGLPGAQDPTTTSTSNPSELSR
jgi:small-conductance mechanosensitive channel